MKPPKITAIILFLGIVFLASSRNSTWAQTDQGGTGNSSISSTSAISGLDVQSSELSSKSSEMPRFQGFDSLNKTSFIGRSESFLFPRTSAGTVQSSSNRGSSSGSSMRTTSGSTAAYGASGNTRTTTTGSRTRSRTGSTRNRNTTGMTGGMSGFGGTNTNTVQSITSLGYFLNETVALKEPVRASQIEYRINTSKIKPLVPITVEIDGSQVILRGVVKNDHERNLLEQFVKLEPGINQVQNELICPIE